MDAASIFSYPIANRAKYNISYLLILVKRFLKKISRQAFLPSADMIIINLRLNAFLTLQKWSS